MAWPAVLEAVSISISGLIDTFMVSSISEDAVAAVGITLNPKYVGLSLYIAVTVAVSALIARRKGEDNRQAANSILITSLVFTIITGVLLSVIFVIFAEPVMRFCGTDSSTHESATQYFKIIMGCMMFNIISMVINAAQRGAGNTQIAMKTNMVSTVVNIICNYLLINGNLGFPALGIRGAAIATVIGTVAASVMSFLSLIRGGYLDLGYSLRNHLGVTKKSLISMIKLGYSVFLEQILLRIGLMAVSIMAAKQGSSAMAAHQVAMNFMGLAFSVGDGMQSAAVALIGQSLGRKMPEEAILYRHTGKLLGMCLSVILAAAYMIFARGIYSLYFDNDDLIRTGVRIMYVLAGIVVLEVWQVIDMGCLRGAGDVLFTTIASTVSVTLVRPIVSYLMCYILGIGIVGIWIGVLLDQISRVIFTLVRFKNDNWTTIKI